MAGLELVRVAGGWWHFIGEGLSQLARLLARTVPVPQLSRPAVPPHSSSPALQGRFGGAGTSPEALRLMAAVYPSVQLCARGTSPARRTRYASGPASAAAATATLAPTATPVSTGRRPRILGRVQAGWSWAGGSSWGDIPEQSLRDGATDALPVPWLCPQGIVPLEGSQLHQGGPWSRGPSGTGSLHQCPVVGLSHRQCWG